MLECSSQNVRVTMFQNGVWFVVAGHGQRWLGRSHHHIRLRHVEDFLEQSEWHVSRMHRQVWSHCQSCKLACGHRLKLSGSEGTLNFSVMEKDVCLFVWESGFLCRVDQREGYILQCVQAPRSLKLCILNFRHANRLPHLWCAVTLSMPLWLHCITVTLITVDMWVLGGMKQL